MSRYSFIDDNINLTGKQCFCIDVNSTNSPFINEGNQIIRPQSPTRSQSPSRSVYAPAPISVSSQVSGYEGKHFDHQSLSSDYLLTPNVINSNPKEQNIITTVNSLLNQVYSNVQKDILESNAPEIDIPKTSMTSMPVDTVKSKIDLNTMANDKLVGKKTVRKSSGNLNLFEGFEQSGCTDVCKPKNRKIKYVRSSKSKSNENIYLLVVIVLFLLLSWFKK